MSPGLAPPSTTPMVGCFIGVDTGTHPDIYNLSSTASASNQFSFINGNLAHVGVAPGESILLPNLTVDQANGSDTFANSYTNQQAVAGIAGDLFWTSSTQITHNLHRHSRSPRLS